MQNAAVDFDPGTAAGIMSRCMVSYRGTNSYRWQRSASVLHAITRLEDFTTAPVDGTHLCPRSSRDARELLRKVQQGPSCPIFYCFTSHRTIRKPVSLVCMSIGFGNSPGACSQAWAQPAFRARLPATARLFLEAGSQPRA